jgi:hypothetical protein
LFLEQRLSSAINKLLKQFLLTKPLLGTESTPKMASSELVDITTACSRRGYLTTVGVVVDVLPPYRTKGSSACVTFTVKDCHFDEATWYGGLKVKYFNDRMDALPPVQRNDVILLRNVRVGAPS